MNLMAEIGRVSIRPDFKNFWDNLTIDKYLPTIHGQRSRRHSRFKFIDDRFELLEAEPYKQDLEINPVMGGIERSFNPIEPEAIQGAIYILKQNLETLPLSVHNTYLINVHFIRILAKIGVIGCPCPEGIHNDGFDYITITCIDRHNISGAESFIYDKDYTLIKEVTLGVGDTIFADDRITKHYTSTFVSKYGWRDTMLTSWELVR